MQGIINNIAAAHLIIPPCVKYYHNLSQDQIRYCFEESGGLFFLSLQGYKYGYRPLPKHLPRAVLDQRKASAALSEEQRALLEEWYLLDEGARPMPRSIDIFI